MRFGIGWMAAVVAAGLMVRPGMADPAAPPASPPPAAPAPPAPAAAPALAPRCTEESASVTIRDSAKTLATIRVPLALHRPANAFRLYGARPLTLQDRGRRRDLYRDAFLELATHARVTPAVNAWASIGKQLEWLGARGANAVLAGQGFPESDPSALSAALKQLGATPAYRNLAAVSRALGLSKGADLAIPEISGPIGEALQLRALATDEADRRLASLGELLDLQDPALDPALREGYLAARGEFEQVRLGLWPAVAASVRRHQGQLVASAVKEIVLSRLGYWAIFGYMGWMSAESALNVEYHGQYAVCLATVASRLAERSAMPATMPEVPSAAPAPPAALAHALYGEFVLNYELTEALKSGQVLPFEPAGGRSVGSWQIQFAGRQDEIRKVLR